MASFEEILTRPASENIAPPAIPVGTYHCIVDGHGEAMKSTQKQTDFIRFKLKIIAPMQDVDARAAAEAQVVGKIIQADYFITDNAVWRIEEFFDHLGIENSGDRGIKERLPEVTNKQILVTIYHETSPDGKRVFHRVRSTAHV